jgi:Zn-dependent M28 family amino/carboxypeptidase
MLRVRLSLGLRGTGLVSVFLGVCLFAVPLRAQVSGGGGDVDGALAYRHVERLVSFGPRPSGSVGSHKTQDYIIAYLKNLNLKVETQPFLANTPNGAIGMKNIVASLPGEREAVILLGSHYDTMPMRNEIFVGANDGGSSTGLLLELARVLSHRKLNYTLQFIFFDGEEAQRQWTETDSLYGSRYFVAQLSQKGQQSKIKAMILMDMIGDKDLVLENELSSTSSLIEMVRKSGQELGHSKHLAKVPTEIGDDHIPFLQAGIPAVVLIDYDYGFNNIYWHTPNDTLDKISPQSLGIVGAIVLKTIEKLNKQ